MVLHPLLAASGAVKRGFLAAFRLLIYCETVQENLRFFPTDATFLQNRCVGCPWQRNRGIINIVQSVAVAEGILREYHMLTPLAHNADEDAPTLNRNVDASDAIAQAFADACIAPLYAD
jgi:hypothetical protein